jgi:hypothetical protein
MFELKILKFFVDWLKYFCIYSKNQIIFFFVCEKIYGYQKVRQQKKFPPLFCCCLILDLKNGKKSWSGKNISYTACSVNPIKFFWIPWLVIQYTGPSTYYRHWSISVEDLLRTWTLPTWNAALHSPSFPSRYCTVQCCIITGLSDLPCPQKITKCFGSIPPFLNKTVVTFYPWSRYLVMK